MRIRSWHFAVRNHRELIPRNILAMQEPGMVESLSKNITRQGLTNTTLNYLRVSEIEIPYNYVPIRLEYKNEIGSSLIWGNKTITNSLHLRQTFVHYTLIIFVDKTRVQKKKVSSGVTRRLTRTYVSVFSFCSSSRDHFSWQCQNKVKIAKIYLIIATKKCISKKKIQSSLLNATAAVASTLP